MKAGQSKCIARMLPSIGDVLGGDPDTLKKLQAKKVIIGATALELGDRFNVPRGRVIPGSLLQVLAA